MFNKWWIHWYHWYHYQIVIHKLECLWFASMACSFRLLLTFDKPAGRDPDPNARPEATIASLAVRKSQEKNEEHGGPNGSRRGDSWHLDIIWHHEFFQVCSTLNVFLLLLWKKSGPSKAIYIYIQRSFLGILLVFHWTVMFEGRVQCSRKSSIRTNH